jgi:hypothetical protein
MHLTDSELTQLRQICLDNPQLKLVSGVTGIVTCDGYAVEISHKDGTYYGVIHPKSVLDMFSRDEKPRNTR